jgi:hypothetical protein
MENHSHIIVSSAPRSGSTPLAQLLGKQGNLCVVNEVGLYVEWDNKNKWTKTAARANWVNHTANTPIFESKGLTLADFRNATIDNKMSGRDQARWLLDNTGAKFIGDKCPIVYINLMPQLAQKFPNAKFIIVVRDGRDVVASQIRGYYRWPPGDPDHAPHWMKNTVKEAQGLWARVAQATLDRIRVIPRDRLFWFRYEDAVKDPQTFCTNLSTFLEVDIENIDGYFKPTNMGRWQKDHPDMMSELSRDFKDMLDYFNYKE